MFLKDIFYNMCTADIINFYRQHLYVNALTLMDLIDDGVDIHEQVDLMIRSGQLYEFLDKCLDRRELEIIVYRYGLYGKSPHTQSETSKKLNISRSYVSRLEKKAIEKLKKMYDTTPF